jgi:hypothetical protein
VDDGTTITVTGRNVAIGTTVLGTNGIAAPNLLGSRSGLVLGWVDADTLSLSAGGCVTTGNTALQTTGGSITFTSLDTGTRTLGVDYAVFLTAAGVKLTAISTYHAAGLVPAGYTAADTCLLGYFHNGKSVSDANAQGAIFQYSITSNNILNRTYPYRAMPDLPQGIPLPGMVRIGGVAFGIYEASHEDATASTAGTSAYPVSRYGVATWTTIEGWAIMQVVAQSGNRLPTWAEWLMAVEFNPGSATPARMNGNSYYGSASDDAYLVAPGVLTAAVGAATGITGSYKYLVTFTNAVGETQAGTPITTAVTPVDQKVDLSAIPTGAAGTTARKIYRTVNGGTTYKLLTTLADNTTATYTDSTLDAALGANAPIYNTTGAQQGTPDPTVSGRILAGTGPRTNLNASTMAGRSWYAPSGLADAVGNVGEYVATFFGGLRSSDPGGSTAWSFEGDLAYNFLGKAYNTDSGGYTEGLPSLLFVGGYWSSGATAGVRYAYASTSPGYAGNSFGFRLAR